MRKIASSFIRNARGQVAIFIALIFQVLFLFFAMVINVGLLVHHKINLQNSVDLAAYYGAMKQAESMNAMGHINYQIRQSWKLLSWRYRMLGTAGDYATHPFKKKPINLIKDDYEGYPQGLVGYQKEYYDVPAFCITYSPFQPMPGNESSCKDQSEQRTIGLFTAPKVIAGFANLNHVLAATTQKALESALARCRYNGQFNYMIMGEFKVGFNFDQGERKQLINMLGRGLSESENDFRELTGDLASVGIKKTLENNLTEANKASLKYTVFNSLGQSACNATGQAATDPPKWLSEIKISPAFMYMDTECQGGGDQPKIIPHPKELGSGPNQLPLYPDQLGDQVQYLAQYVDTLQPPYNSSMGVEKNPWCMAYVGVSATATPKIPFAPLSGVALKARSFAKPFGGKLGPWYMSLWPVGATQSSGGQRTDPLLPTRIADLASIPNANDPSRAANYSRYVGDTAGLKSRVVMGQWGRAIHNLSPVFRGKNNSDMGPVPTGNTAANEPNFWSWNHVGQPFNGEKTGDMLAWDSVNNAYPRMRDLELAAILPDQFDLTYYSIDPDFYHNYYTKIKSYVTKVPGYTYLVRPDLGSRLGVNGLTEFSVRDQYEALKRVSTSDYQVPAPQVDFDDTQHGLLYVAKSVYQILTSWVGKDLDDYSLDTDRFGKCITPRDKDGDPLPSDCLHGGRAGYSVKMVSSDYLLSSDLELGGVGASQGKILNPPPSDF